MKKKLLHKSDYIICLTNESISYLKKKYNFLKHKNFIKIPTCVDMKRFKIKKNINKRKLIFSYLGSIDTAYDIDPVLNFLYKISKIKMDYKIYFFTNKNEILVNKLKNLNISKNNYSIKEIKYNEVPKFLSKTDIGIYSKALGWVTTIIFTILGGIFTIRAGIIKSIFVDKSIW